MSSIKFKSGALNKLVTGVSATARSVIYTASNGAAQIDQCTVKNDSGAAIDCYLYIKSDSTTTGTLVEIIKVNVAADDTSIVPEMIAHKLESGYTIQAFDGSTNGTDLYVTVSLVERAQ